MAIGAIVQVFNRAPWTLSVMKDGRQYQLPPGLSHVTADIVPFARNQNPILGTEDPNDLSYQSLVSVVNPDPSQQDHLRHPLDPIDAETLAAMPKERIDRSLLAPDRQTNVRELTVPFPSRRVGVEAASENMMDPSGALAGNHGG